MADIRELDERTVERIAAGEVVERPASVVKELVENALDADAERVEVAVEAGGTEGVRVTDDGVGMTEQEVRRAVEKHTTSKIADIEDLESGVATLGFRGEALHAIGAVSRTTITTRPPESARGTELTVEGGDVTEVTSAGCPAGTTVEVTDLFYNVPARRKYLKQPSTEFGHVNTVVTSYALANPGVAVSLEHDGRETFATTGQGDLQETVMAVYGRDVASSMLSVDAEVPDGPLDGVAGLVSHPETNRASREYLSTFVNGRYVTANAVRDAVVEAYGSQLASDRYPFAVLDLELDPATVDVNVHPRKLEVRFADEEGVREQVRTAVEETLLSEGLLRSSAPRGRSAPDQADIRPGEGVDDAGDSEGTAGGDAASSDGDSATAAPRETSSGTDSPTDSEHASVSATERAAADRSATGSSGGTQSGTDAAASRDEVHDERGRATDRGRKFTPAHEQSRLGDGEPVEADTAEFDSLPAMRILGQFQDTYVVAETDDGLVLVDQHAADERVNYERLREAFEGGTETQALAEPVRLELTAGEAAAFDAHADALARLGFRADLVDDRTIEVRTVPALLADATGPDLVVDLLADVATGDDAAATVEAAADDLLADLACYPSVTGNTSLREGSVLELLDALDDCDNPYACPHGRPVLVEFDGEEIEARFERDYPGHGG